jgi:HlyD family secretion protein
VTLAILVTLAVVFLKGFSEAEVRLIATRGEYAGWRATRATGDFDLRTFQIRAYPVEKIADLRPGMSAYADWAGARR